MRFPGDAPVRPEKLEELRRRIAAVGLDLDQVEERALRGSGPGGQKINRSMSMVQLRYPPADLVIRCQDDRRRTLNRFLALRRLVEALEQRRDPAAPDPAAERIRKQKARRRRRRRED
jgi:protein subunit release factor B